MMPSAVVKAMADAARKEVRDSAAYGATCLVEPATIDALALATIDGLRYRAAWEALDFVLDQWEAWAKAERTDDQNKLSGPDEALLTAIGKARVCLAAREVG